MSQGIYASLLSQIYLSTVPGYVLSAASTLSSPDQNLFSQFSCKCFNKRGVLEILTFQVTNFLSIFRLKNQPTLAFLRNIDTTYKHQAGVPPLVGYPVLLVQYIRSHSPCLLHASFIRNLRQGPT
jgi:hypothetical protein